MSIGDPLERALKEVVAVEDCHFSEAEPVADERSVEKVRAAAYSCDHLLAVGSGTLNDLAKYAGFLLGKPSSVFATAPSMDGYTSAVAPLIEGGFKITRPSNRVENVLVDLDVLKNAPRVMIGAGVGDILAKYCCLTDWRISAHLMGEHYDAAAASLMEEAVVAMDESLPALFAGKEEGVARLMDALLVSGYAMVVAGSSRPASGAEHHMSHFLEMDFLRRGQPIPLHGLKVGLGTLVSLYLYHTLERRARRPKWDMVYAEAAKLPPVERAEDIMKRLGCPVKFSQIGVSRETVKEMFFSAYKIRDRYTILTLYCTEGLMTDETAEELLERFY